MTHGFRNNIELIPGPLVGVSVCRSGSDWTHVGRLIWVDIFQAIIEIRMGERHRGRNALRWIKLEELFQKVDSYETARVNIPRIYSTEMIMYYAYHLLYPAAVVSSG